MYLAGRIGDEQVSLHTEGERVLLTGEDGVRQEVDLKAPGKRVVAGEEGPGESVLDDVLEDLRSSRSLRQMRTRRRRRRCVMPTKKKENVQGLKGSRASRKAVAAILEALSGEIGTAEAAELMGVSLSRYYQLEARALQGMLGAMEPKKRGIQKTPEREILGLEAEKKLLEKELRRHQSLLAGRQSQPGAGQGRAQEGKLGVQGP